ncbi:hypothetical protein PoB_005626400 [Plakobranchus ocellatus]|uniref:Uncharacterized protein n=1 Tax=Plakobranchus ocellatus TaxID=259542 RepID=A0AAV4CG44_9GAST|nr:hypothetical protein PoB_005626400 [Plakobranchus ocellatus]
MARVEWNTTRNTMCYYSKLQPLPSIAGGPRAANIINPGRLTILHILVRDRNVAGSTLSRAITLRPEEKILIGLETSQAATPYWLVTRNVHNDVTIQGYNDYTLTKLANIVQHVAKYRGRAQCAASLLDVKLHLRWSNSF